MHHTHSPACTILIHLHVASLAPCSFPHLHNLHVNPPRFPAEKNTPPLLRVKWAPMCQIPYHYHPTGAMYFIQYGHMLFKGTRNVLHSVRPHALQRYAQCTSFSTATCSSKVPTHPHIPNKKMLPKGARPSVGPHPHPPTQPTLSHYPR
jgi:hypothetical protein